jgi:Zn-dependent peptidase ImmA (M78 family)
MSKGLSGVRADNKYSYRKLEAFAAYVREELKFAPGQAIDPLRLFEDLHQISIRRSDGKIIPLRGGVIAVEDSEGYTRYDRKHNVIEILASENTYQRLEIRHPRAVYFVAHELGHCVLHTDQLVRLAQMPTNQQAAFHRGREDHRPFEDTEWQANAFASALLMPARGIADLEQDYAQLTASLIADQFGVSHEAAGYRLDLYNSRRNELLR